MTFLNAINNSVRRNSSTRGQAVSFTALLWLRNCQTVVASVAVESLLNAPLQGFLALSPGYNGYEFKTLEDAPTSTRLSGKAELTGIGIATSTQETVRSAIRDYGEVVLRIGICRGIGSMARCGVLQ
jgi:hypothetical protein